MFLLGIYECISSSKFAILPIFDYFCTKFFSVTKVLSQRPSLFQVKTYLLISKFAREGRLAFFVYGVESDRGFASLPCRIIDLPLKTTLGMSTIVRAASHILNSPV